ncbi:MFS transporter [Pacificimonas sp. WHA3]|uniref:MFS transporter n=1 Tax=Pacificimonas pallii TaxID=2827236 RepID=A0ABS6SBL7_9SPHN|nr:MFS transporter [Pacificimonas pallii]MBV7255272.1 MFS transporter [Pacificimonas pallii]
MTAVAAQPRPAEAAGPGRANYVLAVLLTIYIFSYIDRALISVVARPLRADIAISDTVWGLMSGFAFAMFYAGMGIPLARMAERFNRVKLIVICLCLWSAMTMLSGLAYDFAIFGFTVSAFYVLLVCRIGVAVGEAGCSPAANSLIADVFRPEKRAWAVGVYAMGVTLGNVLANFIGGPLADVVGWRMAFILLGAPGILLAALALFTIPEPRRGATDPGYSDADASEPGLQSALKELGKRKSYWLMLIGATCAAFAGYGQLSFQSLYLQRQFSLSAGEAGVMINTPSYITGALGTILVGKLAQTLFHRYPAAITTISAIGMACSVPFYILAFRAGTTVECAIHLSIATFLTYGYLTTQYTVCQLVVGARVRATATAILLFVMTIIGYGLGPLFAGTISDWEFAQSRSGFASEMTRHSCDAAQQAVTDARRAAGDGGGSQALLEASLPGTMSFDDYQSCISANAQSTQSAMIATSLFYLLAGFFFALSSLFLRRDIRAASGV